MVAAVAVVLVVVLGVVVWLQGCDCCRIGILARAGKLPGRPGLRSGLVLVLSRVGFEAHFWGLESGVALFL